MPAMESRIFNFHDKDYYYIHRRIDHFEKDSAMALFQQQKQQGYELAKARFQKNYLMNVSGLNKESLARLEDAMSEEEIISSLDQSFLKVLNDEVSESIKKYDLESKLNKAYESLNKYLNTNDVKELDTLFFQITSAANLLNTSRTELMSLIGINGKYRQHRDLTKLYSEVDNTIKSYEKKVVNVSQQKMLSVLKSLKSLVAGLNSNKTNKDSLQKSLTNIFSTQIGEYIVSRGVAESLGLTLAEIRKSLSGTSDVQFEEDPELKKFIQNYGQKGKQVFKTDNSLKNVIITLEDGNEFIINLGLNTKWYKNSGNLSRGVKIAGEKSFVNRINQMFNNADRYYVYNAIGLSKQDESLYASLRSSIIARNIDILISGLGTQGDFSQYIVINGNFYSIWQIINLLENYNSGRNAVKNSATDPITLKVPGYTTVASYTQKSLRESSNRIKAFVRSRQQNQLIQSLKLEANFFPSRLKNIVNKT